MDTSVRLLFAPEDSKKCVNISILTDSVTERPEIFEVVAELNFQDSAAAIISPSTVIVVIIDGSYVGEAKYMYIGWVTSTIRQVHKMSPISSNIAFYPSSIRCLLYTQSCNSATYTVPSNIAGYWTSCL